MVYGSESSRGRRIWKGDPATVAEARRAYANDPEGQLLPFAVALYSFRRRRQFAEELIAIRGLLLNLAEKFLRSDCNDSHRCTPESDVADVLSTHIEWIARQDGISPTERFDLMVMV